MRSWKGPTLDSRVSGADLGAGGTTEAVPFRHYQDDCYEVTHARSRIQEDPLDGDGDVGGEESASVPR